MEKSARRQRKAFFKCISAIIKKVIIVAEIHIKVNWKLIQECSAQRMVIMEFNSRKTGLKIPELGYNSRFFTVLNLQYRSQYWSVLVLQVHVNSGKWVALNQDRIRMVLLIRFHGFVMEIMTYDDE